MINFQVYNWGLPHWVCPGYSPAARPRYKGARPWTTSFEALRVSRPTGPAFGQDQRGALISYPFGGLPPGLWLGKSWKKEDVCNKDVVRMHNYIVMDVMCNTMGDHWPFRFGMLGSAWSPLAGTTITTPNWGNILKYNWFARISMRTMLQPHWWCYDGKT